jgi:uncharacterized protein (TIGR03067 family)
MKRSFLWLLMLLLTGLLPGGYLAAADDEPKSAKEGETAQASESAKQELEKLQGAWVMLSYESKEKKRPDVGITTVTIKDDQWTMTSGEKVAANLKIKIDQSQDPKTIDRITSSGSKRLGIYKLHGDTLTICSESGDGVRPAEFKTTKDGGIISVFKRASK